MKAALARKPIGLEQNFVLAVVNYVAGEMLRFGMFADVLVHATNCIIFAQLWQNRGD
jgi:hypothetical protein